ncbi:DUF2339 domain-containing protein [Mycolicibacterium palauense]|uniref:DUF2339 domain-containing protein n=1 Tax=Mycolicibacterium palauense TaxID=2034511 RepID=UPI000BFEC6D5|nr:DUF2339 domain-containing protein [Mycolicibacterium palauense]
MTESPQLIVERLSSEFTAMSTQFARASVQLAELRRALGAPMPAGAAAPPFPGYPTPPPPPVSPPPTAPSPPVPPADVHRRPAVHAYPPPSAHPYPRPPVAAAPAPRVCWRPEQGWIGKVLAVAGVAVTLVGVVLLLILAAQAGLLRPEIRVGAGAALAGALVLIAIRWNRRQGGRVGAIAVAATGIAAAYMDVVAVTSIYGWLPPAGGLLLAAAVGAAGLVLARRWDSEQLGLLVLIPLLILAPVVTEGFDLLLVGFLLALSASALPVQLGRDWIWLHAARVAAGSVPVLLALPAAAFGNGEDPWLLGGACGVAALLAVLGALVLLPGSTHKTAMALITAGGVLPALAAGDALDRLPASLMAAAVSVAMLAIVLAGDRLAGVTGPVRLVWSVLAAVAALVAVTVAFDGEVAGPVLVGLATIVSLAGRRSAVARWIAMGFALLGATIALTYLQPGALLTPTALSTPVAVSTLVTSVLLIAATLSIAWTWTVAPDHDDDLVRVLWVGTAAVCAYAVTAFTVTVGVLIAGPDGGFLAGHMAATICWVAIAAGLLVVGLRTGDRETRTASIVGGLALTAAATAKLFLFDLATLDGMFRVTAFIVVGLALLAMGAGYARSLARQERPEPPPEPSGKDAAERQ